MCRVNKFKKRIGVFDAEKYMVDGLALWDNASSELELKAAGSMLQRAAELGSHEAKTHWKLGKELGAF